MADIDISGYVRAVWQRRNRILLVAFIPSAVVLAILLLLPRKYELMYYYNVPQNVGDAEQLSRCYYSTDSIDALAKMLSEAGYDDVADDVRKTFIRDGLEGVRDEIVSMMCLPKYQALPKSRAGDPKAISLARALSHSAIQLQVIAESNKDVMKLAGIFRDHFESRVPIYLLRRVFQVELRDLQAEHRNLTRAIVDARQSLAAAADRLSRLESLKTIVPDESLPQSPAALAAIIKDNRFLPLSYHIQAAQIDLSAKQVSLKAAELRLASLLDRLHIAQQARDYLADDDATVAGLAELFTTIARSPEASQVARDYAGSWSVYTLSFQWKDFRALPRPTVHQRSKWTVVITSATFVGLLLLQVLAVLGALALKEPD